MDTKSWHKRFKIQATWTEAVRSYLLQTILNKTAKRAIEIGSGTGAVLSTLSGQFSSLFGLDINLEYLEYSQQIINTSHICADGASLPFSSKSFDIVYCHFLLLWLKYPETILAETYRILSNSGSILLFAEPDYGGRIDYPPALEELGIAQTTSLKEQGANPLIGRQLSGLLYQTGFKDIQIGILGSQRQPGFDQAQWQSEWDMFQFDLKGVFSPAELARFKQIDLKAYQKNQRVLYIPTFYALAKK